MVQSQEFHWPASDGAAPLYGKAWYPDGLPFTGLLQLVHGLNDRIDRYEGFARWMASRGWLVFGEDHLGQGKSVKRFRQLGYTALEGGWQQMADGVYALGRQVWKRYPQLNWFVLGHSMGSLLVRTCLIDHPDAFDGCVLTGTTSHPNPRLEALIQWCEEEKARFGPEVRSQELAERVFGSEFLHFDPSADALSAEGQVDLLCSFLPSVQLFEDLFQGMRYVQERESEGYPHGTLPLLFLSGAEDPTNQQGERMLSIAAQFSKLGYPEIQTRLLPGKRHELLNCTGAEPVYRLIERWLSEKMEGTPPQNQTCEPLRRDGFPV